MKVTYGTPVPCPTYDSKYHSPFRTELHEHICGDNQHGLADAVGFDEVPEEATS